LNGKEELLNTKEMTIKLCNSIQENLFWFSKRYLVKMMNVKLLCFCSNKLKFFRSLVRKECENKE
jgi:hypothetical protein